YVMALNNLSFALMNELKLDEAAKHLEAAIKIEPDFSFAIYNLGIVYFNRNKAEDRVNARKLFLKIQEFEPKGSPLYKLSEDAIAQVDRNK
ncbi:MAG TPA: tetratricopeptide repeat protein, partial [Candidatus Wallbacteria bacterium]|nr:tetratricopeptide repeat protein [Candidatus Wallbacteria bacterium]